MGWKFHHGCINQRGSWHCQPMSSDEIHRKFWEPGKVMVYSGLLRVVATWIAVVTDRNVNWSTRQEAATTVG